MTGFLEGLNERQIEAVTVGNENTLVLAGAGSGKTRVLVTRIAWLIHSMHIPSNAILAVTFTNKAASEMKSRLHELQLSTEGIWVGTFHGICNRMLRHHWNEAGLPQQFHIIDSDDQARIIKRVIASLNLDEERWPVKQAQAFINGKKDEGLRPQHIDKGSFGPDRTLVQIYSAYEAICQKSGHVDFADLVLKTLELLRDHPEIGTYYRERFRAILVDEFQDTNTVQYAWVRMLAHKDASVMVVGDDDQSIYGWRGANVGNIHQFSTDFPNTRIVRLEQNYRSTGNILEAANALINNNYSRMGKKLWTEQGTGSKIKVYTACNELDEARYIAESIRNEVENGRSLDSIAILYRSNAQSRVLEEALLRFHIAYHIHGGLRFFDRAEIKDALAYTRLLLNRNDDSAFERIVNFPARSIGDKTLDVIRLKAGTDSLSLWEASNQLIQESILPARAGNALAGFIQLIDSLEKEVCDLTLEKQFEKVIHLSGLYDLFSAMKGEKAESKVANLEELINAAGEFHQQTDGPGGMILMTEFLSHASLEAGEMQAAEYESAVHLMTLHAGKGLEFPLVFLTGMEEGLFPSKQSVQEPKKLEEERRLCYVGMTRAMERLCLSHAEIRRQYGREERHKCSRFLNEIPKELLDWKRMQNHFQPQMGTSFQQALIEETGFYRGQTVTHPKFGEGVVMDSEGSGSHARVHVRFNSGSKWLILAYANLEKME